MLIDHVPLLDELSYLEVTGRLLLITESYLPDRSEHVKTGGISSFPKNVTSGVPQGSLLMSLLFIAYINYRPDCCGKCLSLLCTDDAKLIFFGLSKNNFQLGLSRIANWSNKHMMLLKTDKFSHLSLTWKPVSKK